MNNRSPDEILGDLRVEIDRIDASVHSLLIERGEIIDRLIAVKHQMGGGSAFRPGREAAMMRALLMRHRGLLPLDTIEGIWRIIISTFTFVQASFSVHADFSGGDAGVRDSARFHFGFTVPLIAHEGVAGVIDAVALASGDLGLVRLDGGAAKGAWWTALAPPTAPKVISRLPMVQRQDHPASLAVFVVSKPLNEAASREVIVYSIRTDRWHNDIEREVRFLGGEMLASAADEPGLSLLVSAPGAFSAKELRKRLLLCGCNDIRISEIGSHAAINRV